MMKPESRNDDIIDDRHAPPCNPRSLNGWKTVYDWKKRKVIGTVETLGVKKIDLHLRRDEERNKCAFDQWPAHGFDLVWGESPRQLADGVRA